MHTLWTAWKWLDSPITQNPPKQDETRRDADEGSFSPYAFPIFPYRLSNAAEAQVDSLYHSHSL